MNVNKIFDKIPYGTFANFKPAHYYGMAGGLVVLIFGLMFFLVFSPNAEEKAQLEKKLEDTENKLALYLTEGARKGEMTKEVAALYGSLGEKKRQLPLAEEVPQLIQKIADIGDFLGVDIVAFKLEPPQNNVFYKSIPVSVTIAGNYYKTAGFFDSLQNLLRVVNVKDFKMDLQPGFKIVINEDGEKEQEEIDVLQTQITAHTFAYIDGSENVDK
jgi:type IV pilus assembly protein PilO